MSRGDEDMEKNLGCRESDKLEEFFNGNLMLRGEVQDLFDERSGNFQNIDYRKIRSILRVVNFNFRAETLEKILAKLNLDDSIYD